MKPSTDSYRLDETYVKIKGKWYYLYQATRSKGNTLDFLLSRNRDKKAARKFIKRVLSNNHAVPPRVINTDKAPAYVSAIRTLKFDKELNWEVLHRPIQYLNNILEQAGCMASSEAKRSDQHHRFIKGRIKPMLGFFSFKTANRILQGIEAMHMIKKIQIKDFFKCFRNEKNFMNILLGIAA